MEFSNDLFYYSLLILAAKPKKKANTVKPISVKDEKILNHAIEIVNEMSAKYVLA